MKIFDISPALSSRTAVFPGDTPFERKTLMDFKKGDPYVLSSLHLTSHCGAHADAPLHYHPEGESIEKRNLNRYFGKADLIHLPGLRPGERISPHHLPRSISFSNRVLFRTDSFLDPDKWKPDFNSLSPELIQTLNAQNVRLVGIDTPSIDPADSKALESHQAVYQSDLAILEGLKLNEIPSGSYYLIALPLKIEGGEASPVRAILIQDFEIT